MIVKYFPSSPIHLLKTTLFCYQDSPEHKKFRTSATAKKSVFSYHTTRTRNGDPIKSNGRKDIEREPLEGHERLKLALKLPDGKRVERYFAPTNTINDVMNFARTKMRSAGKRLVVYSMLQVPKVKLRNWKQTLAELGFIDRTMLYIDED